jgi:hypothetical protein
VAQALGSPATVLGVVAFAVFLRIAVYAADRSVLIDEAFIALNLERRSAVELAGELDWNQAAPLGFLELEKAMTSSFGSSEYVLRAAPLVASLVALVLFARVAAAIVRGYAVPLAVVVFGGIALGTSYAAIAKPYSFDLVFVLALYLYAMRVIADEDASWSIVALGALGVIAPLFSYASVFAVAACGTLLLADSLVARSRRRLVQASAVVGLWLVMLLVVYFTHGSTLSNLRRSFPNDTLRSSGSLRDAAGELRLLLGVSDSGTNLGYTSGLGSTLSMVAALCAALFIIAGAVRLVRSNWRAAALLLLPAFYALVASVFGWYPTFPRAILFLAPTLAITAAEGFRYLFELVRSLFGRAALVALFALFIAAEVGSTVGAINTVRPDDGMKPVMHILARDERHADTVYLNFSSQYAFAHYLECMCAGSDVTKAARERLWPVMPVGGTPDQWAPALKSESRHFRVGEFRGYDLKRYRAELARLPKHGRVWVVLSGLTRDERRAMLRPLDRRGRRLIAHRADGDVTTVSAVLYAF